MEKSVSKYEYKGYCYELFKKEGDKYFIIITNRINTIRFDLNSDVIKQCSELINPMKLLALGLAYKKHFKQLDRGGHPYFGHVKYVGNHCKKVAEQVVGYLHDIIEDTDMTLPQLDQYFPEDIISAVDSISRRPGEKELPYFTRIKSNKIAINVKIQDLLNNLNFSRMEKYQPNKEDRQRLIKYANEVEELMEIVESNK